MAPDNNGLRMDTTILLQLSKITSYFITSTYYITPNELKSYIQPNFNHFNHELDYGDRREKFVMPAWLPPPVPRGCMKLDKLQTLVNTINQENL
jgi:hypothetical protein